MKQYKTALAVMELQPWVNPTVSKNITWNRVVVEGIQPWVATLGMAEKLAIFAVLRN